jgi:hypothetical protein
MLIPSVGCSNDTLDATNELFEPSSTKSRSILKWEKVSASESDSGLKVKITTEYVRKLARSLVAPSRSHSTLLLNASPCFFLQKVIRQMVWHQKGDYVATVSPDATNRSMLFIHQLSSRRTQTPFRKLKKGKIQCVQFHPKQPQLFIATQTHIRILDLRRLRMVKKLNPVVSWLSSMSIHPEGITRTSFLYFSPCSARHSFSLCVSVL